MKYGEYGQKSMYGWEIDHIWPLNPGGTQPHGSNTYSNVQPLHWKSNDEKSNRLKGQVNRVHFEVQKKEFYENKIIGVMKINGILAYDYSKWQ